MVFKFLREVQREGSGKGWCCVWAALLGYNGDEREGKGWPCV
jgi:hypothetical protein